MIREPEYATLGAWTKTRRPLQFSLAALRLFDVKQPTPVVLSAIRGYKSGLLKWGELCSTIRAVEDFHFYVHGIASKSSSGGITNMYSNHARRLAAATTKAEAMASIADLKAKLVARKPEFDEFDTAFKTILYTEDNTAVRRLVRYILYRLSCACSPAVPISFEDSTIEHLFSRNPEKSRLPGAVVNSLGNLLLVEEAFNRDQLQNRPPLEKLAILDRAGYPLDRKLQEALKNQVWDQEAIEGRRDWLAEIAYKDVWLA